MMRIGRNKLTGLTMLVAMATSQQLASAATTTFNFTTQITVTANCAINVTSMNFGNIVAVTGTETATSTATVKCSLGIPYTVSFRPNAVLTAGTGSLAGPGGNIPFFVSLATTSGTGSGSHTLNGKLNPSAITTQGLYQNNFLIYVNY
jgi:Spore Coat Protein U domain